MDNSNVPNTILDPHIPHEQNSALALIEDAINGIPLVAKKGYVEAMRQAPHLLCLETDPVDYLRFENYNVWAAAQRFLKYWECKSCLFQERAFLPIDKLDGTGALGKEELKLMQSGFFVLLPKNQNGNSVTLFDRSRLAPQDWETINPIRNLRICFYFAHLAYQEQRASRTPISEHTSVCVLNLVVKIPTFQKNTGDIAKTVSETMPLQIIVHSIFLPKGIATDTLLQLVVPAVRQNLRRAYNNKTLHFHVGFTEQEVLQQLTSCGFASDGLPDTLGGTWSFDNFSEWLARQQGPLVSNVSTRSNFHNIAPAEIATVVRNEQTQPIHSLCKVNALDEVCERAPHLLHEESIDSAFIMYNKNSVNTAGKHLMKHWETRRTLFRERFLLPMSQTGFGALNDEDLATMETGFVMVLPMDRTGRGVLSIDLSRSENCSIESQRRCFFYILHLFTKKPQTCERGFVLFFSMICIEPERISDECAFCDILKAFPINLVAVHVLLQAVGLGWLSYQERALAKVTTILQPAKDQTFTHIVSKNDDISQDLSVAHGFDVKNLPVSVGGKWRDSNFKKWRTQILHEEKRSTKKRASSDEKPSIPKKSRSVAEEVFNQSCIQNTVFCHHQPEINPNLLSALEGKHREVKSSGFGCFIPQASIATVSRFLMDQSPTASSELKNDDSDDICSLGDFRGDMSGETDYIPFDSNLFDD